MLWHILPSWNNCISCSLDYFVINHAALLSHATKTWTSIWRLGFQTPQISIWKKSSPGKLHLVKPTGPKPATTLKTLTAITLNSVLIDLIVLDSYFYSVFTSYWQLKATSQQLSDSHTLMAEANMQHNNCTSVAIWGSVSCWRTLQHTARRSRDLTNDLPITIRAALPPEPQPPQLQDYEKASRRWTALSPSWDYDGEGRQPQVHVIRTHHTDSRTTALFPLQGSKILCCNFYRCTNKMYLIISI